VNRRRSAQLDERGVGWRDVAGTLVESLLFEPPVLWIAALALLAAAFLWLARQITGTPR
jgi:hypothetical protein